MNFLEVVLVYKSSVVLSVVKSVESVLKTDRLAVVSCVKNSWSKGNRKIEGKKKKKEWKQNDYRAKSLAPRKDKRTEKIPPT